jgi:hypothetical protein
LTHPKHTLGVASCLQALGFVAKFAIVHVCSAIGFELTSLAKSSA